MYSEIYSAILEGIDSTLVSVETDISDGLPVFEMVGHLAQEVKESKERVRTALRNNGFLLPVKRITVNFSPANIRKTGSGFDLPIAVGLLVAMGFIRAERTQDIMVIGELGLYGNILPVNGILSMVSLARDEKLRFCIVPEANAAEASLIPGITCYPANHISQILSLLGEDDEARGQYIKSTSKLCKPAGASKKSAPPDFSAVNGQGFVKRACEVAVSGMHNLLMIGPPGSGKTMIARCIPSILPPMTDDEKLELSKIYSVAGLFSEREALMENRPFRSPHHTISPVGLTGGGSAQVCPGEISLAHCGVLFLDEFLEFSKSTLEILRQPMEDKVVNITRNIGCYTFPADFMLVAAMNPCNCGYYPDLNRCHCTPQSITRYLGKMSRPMLDRIDISVEAPQINYSQLTGGQRSESSADIRSRVMQAMEIQKKRFEGTDIRFNSAIPSSDIPRYCSLLDADKAYMEQTYKSLGLSARAYYKILKVARTIADLAGNERIRRDDLLEAVMYRSIDRKFWER